MSATPAGTQASGKVDFYVLTGAGEGARRHFACRLVEKVWLLGNRIFVHADSPDVARELDQLLWTFREDSFVPHTLLDAREAAPVIVGDGREPATDLDVLVNLGEGVPAFVEACARVTEIVEASPAGRAAGRERYRRYGAQGFAIETHEISGGP